MFMIPRHLARLCLRNILSTHISSLHKKLVINYISDRKKQNYGFRDGDNEVKILICIVFVGYNHRETRVLWVSFSDHEL